MESGSILDRTLNLLREKVEDLRQMARLEGDELEQYVTDAEPRREELRKEKQQLERLIANRG